MTKNHSLRKIHEKNPLENPQRNFKINLPKKIPCCAENPVGTRDFLDNAANFR